MHLKDYRPAIVEEVKAHDLSFLQGVRKGAFTVPGDGAIDFAPIFQGAGGYRLRGLDGRGGRAGPRHCQPLQSAVKARAYIREKTGL